METNFWGKKPKFILTQNVTEAQKRNFLLKQMEILQEKATDMTVGNYYAVNRYYKKKLDRLSSLPVLDHQLPVLGDVKPDQPKI